MHPNIPDCLKQEEQAYLLQLGAADLAGAEDGPFHLLAPKRELKKLQSHLQSFRRRLPGLQEPQQPVVLICRNRPPSLCQPRDGYRLLLVSDCSQATLFHELVHLYFPTPWPFWEEGLAGYCQVFLARDYPGEVINSRNLEAVVRDNPASWVDPGLLAAETAGSLDYFHPDNLGSFRSTFAFYEAIALARRLIDAHGLDSYTSFLQRLVGEETPSAAAQFGRSLEDILSEFSRELGHGVSETAVVQQENLDVDQVLAERYRDEEALLAVKAELAGKADLRLDHTLAQHMLMTCYHLSNLYEIKERKDKNQALLDAADAFVERCRREGLPESGDLCWLVPELAFRRIRFLPHRERIKAAAAVEDMYRAAFAGGERPEQTALSYGRFKLFSPPIIGGNTAEAISYFQDAVSVAHSAEALAWLARAWQYKGDKEQARRFADEALEQDEEQSLARDILSEL